MAVLTLASIPAAALAGGPRRGVEAVANAAVEAVSRLRPLVVQVQPIGAAAGAGSLDALGPTTGLYLAEHGCVITSSYRTTGAAGLLIFFEEGHRSAATIVATDHHRKLVLLRVTEPPPDAPAADLRGAAMKGLRVGQTCVAVGRVYRRDEPNLATGILSARRRLLGLAVQTDAGVSPANYGGPLVDLSGRVIGVLTPLTPPSGAPSTGADWYDSGVGFAVPWESVIERLPTLLAGEDIRRGLLGVSLARGNAHRTAPTIAKLHPNGPSSIAGLEEGDRITTVNGKPTANKTAFRFALGNRDAGDELEIDVDRGGAPLRFVVRLVAELPPAKKPIGPKVGPPTSAQADQAGGTATSISETPAATSGNAPST